RGVVGCARRRPPPFPPSPRGGPLSPPPVTRPPPPPRRTGQAVLPHPALLSASPPGLCDLPQRQRFRRHSAAYSTWSARIQPSPGRISPRSGLADRWVLFSGHPCLPCCRRSHGQQGPFAPRALPRFAATTGPSATLSPSADFPVLPVIRPTQLPPFPVGTRRASPVPRCVLVPLPSLTAPPERSAASIGLRRAVLPSPYSCGLGLRGYALSGPPRVHWRYGPATRTHPKGEVVKGLQDRRFPS